MTSRVLLWFGGDQVKKKLIITIILIVILAIICIAGYRSYEQHVINEILDEPEPSSCNICNYIGKHAPCVVSLSTGEIGELVVYHPGAHGFNSISTDWDGGTFSFIQVPEGLSSWRNSWDQSNHCYVPIKGNSLKAEYFCKSCRSMLLQASRRGFVIVDCNDKDSMTAYPIERGKEYVIRGYDITITKKEGDRGELEVITQGHYMDGMIPSESN